MLKHSETIYKQEVNKSHCEAESSFEDVFSDQRTILAKISQSLRKNKKQTVKAFRYNQSWLANIDISSRYTVTVRKKLNTLQKISERHSSNDKYENFEPPI